MKKTFAKITALFLSALLCAGCSPTEKPNPETSDNSLDVSQTSSESLGESSAESSSEQSSESLPESEPEPVSQTVSFCAVGDNLIHNVVYQQAKTEDGYDFTYAYQNVADEIAAADVAVINQETLICNDAYPPSNWPFFNSPTQLGDHMIDIGFDIFTIANNHCLDYGEDGIKNTLDYWESRDVLMAGMYHKGDDRIRIDERKGIKFSYLAFTDNTNGLKQIPNSQFEIGNANDLEEMTTYIKAAKEVSDICIVALHWGFEESTVITEQQRQTARKLSEAGADIILGTSPHVLRDIEVIHTEERDTLCAYSLGNFISAQNAARNMISGILKFNVTVTKGEKPVISDIKLTPVVIHYGRNYDKIRLYMLRDYTRELAAEHGTRQFNDFDYDYIINFLKNVISEEYLDM